MVAKIPPAGEDKSSIRASRVSNSGSASISPPGTGESPRYSVRGARDLATAQAVEIVHRRAPDHRSCGTKSSGETPIRGAGGKSVVPISGGAWLARRRPTTTNPEQPADSASWTRARTVSDYYSLRESGREPARITAADLRHTDAGTSGFPGGGIDPDKLSRVRSKVPTPTVSAACSTTRAPCSAHYAQITP